MKRAELLITLILKPDPWNWSDVIVENATNVQLLPCRFEKIVQLILFFSIIIVYAYIFVFVVYILRNIRVNDANDALWSNKFYSQSRVKLFVPELEFSSESVKTAKTLFNWFDRMNSRYTKQ